MIDIFIDSREQKPLEFTAEYIKSSTVVKLPFGDYGAKFKGERIPVVFERKSLPDLCGTLGKGYSRFKKEINRAIKENILLVIIIEVNLLKVLAGYKRSKMNGLGLVRTLFTLMIKHHIPFVACKNRAEMMLYISEFFYSYAKNIRKKDG